MMLLAKIQNELETLLQTVTLLQTIRIYCKDNRIEFSIEKCAKYLSLPPTRHDLTQGQKPEGRLKWG